MKFKEILSLINNYFHLIKIYIKYPSIYILDQTDRYIGEELRLSNPKLYWQLSEKRFSNDPNILNDLKRIISHE